MTTLQGRRIVLREKTADDAFNDYRWRSDPELARLDDTSPLRMSFSDFLKYYEDELKYPTPGRHRFAIEADDGKHIGNCMYYDLDSIRGEAELGILIGERDYWSQGYGTESVKAMLNYLFSKYLLRKVYLHTLDWNIRAQKAFAKCGFIAKRKVRRAGSTLIAMEALREDWEAQRQQQANSDAS